MGAHRFVLYLSVTVILLAACERDVEPASLETEGRTETLSTPEERAPTQQGEAAAEPRPTPKERAGQEEGEEAAERLAWVAVEDGDLLALVDLDAGTVVEEHAAPGGPHNIVVTDDGTVATALYASNEVLILRDGQTEAVELGGSPHDVKATDGLFVVANEVAERIDLVSTDGEHLTSIPLTAQPHDAGITPDGSRAWVTMNETDQLAVVDLEAGEVVEYVATGQSPHNLLFAPDGETFWVTDWSGEVLAFTATGEFIESFPVGEEAHHLAFTPDGSEVWVTDHHTRQIYVFDVADRQLVAELPVPGMPHHVNITPDGALAAVADHTNGTVVVYDVDTREQTTTIEVGAGPHGVWVVP